MWLGIETSSVVSSVAVMNESQLIGEITIQSWFDPTSSN